MVRMHSGSYASKSQIFRKCWSQDGETAMQSKTGYKSQ